MKREKPLIAISACLLGQNVRYNKGNTREKWIVTELGKYVDFLPICPEMESGLGTPREEIHLRYDEQGNNRLYTKYSRQDITMLSQQAYKRLDKLIHQHDVDGFIFMKKSPSCGLMNISSIPVEGKGRINKAAGLFAQYIMDNFPTIPKEESGRLHDAKLRENFVKSIFAHFRFRQARESYQGLEEFHKRYKYILMEHSQASLKELGTILAKHNRLNVDEIGTEYYQLFFQTIKHQAPCRKRYNALMHIMGYFKKHLDSDEKQNLLQILDDYRDGINNYTVPLNMFNYFVGKYNVSYLADHYYFSPYPKDLKLMRDI